MGGTDDASNASTVCVSGPSQACSGALIRVDNDLGFVLTAPSCKGMANIVYPPLGVMSYTDPMGKTFAVTQDTADPNGHNFLVLQFKGATADMIVTPAAYGAVLLRPVVRCRTVRRRRRRAARQ